MKKKSMWDELNKIQKEMNSFIRNYAFTDWEEGFSQNTIPYQGTSIVPANFRQPLTDVYETEKYVIAKMEIPGVEKKDIDINIKGNAIEVRVNRKSEKEISDNDKGTHRYERRHSGYYRYVTMPAYARLDELDAKYENGILELKAPKDEKLIKRGKKITVK